MSAAVLSIVFYLISLVYLRSRANYPHRRPYAATAIILGTCWLINLWSRI